MAKTKTAPKKAPVNTRLHVGVVLDRSGSMGSVWRGAIAGLNDYVGQLKADADADSTYLTLAAFDDTFEVIYQDAPLVEIPEFDGTEFPPRGSTALNDSIADTISVMKDSIGDDKALLVVLTDGFENASKRYPNDRKTGKCPKLIAMVNEFEATGNWTFVYLGANDPDVYESSGSLGFSPGNTAAYTASATGTPAAFASVGNVTAKRKHMRAASSLTSFEDAGESQDLREDDDPTLNAPKPPVVARTGDLAKETGLLDHLGS